MILTINEAIVLFTFVILLSLLLFVVGYFSGKREGREETHVLYSKAQREKALLEEIERKQDKKEIVTWIIKLKDGEGRAFRIKTDFSKKEGDFIIFYLENKVRFVCHSDDIIFAMTV